MSGFLADTLLWTGALLALVLLIRRPVASHLGPGAAYALWALPMGRLLLPPLVLPAWLAPAPDPAVLSAAPLEAPLALGGSAGMAPVAAAATPDWTGLLLAVWLAGAAVFLIRRYALYFRMRRELLARARPVGEAGRIRLVETPDADGPVAFGVIDKVIALPPGFMASRERTARDLALAHELAHHRGHDLICNMLVQPLFALHWFNPLSTLGWRALRRDQEAACDARVVAHCPREARAAYAAVIARFATQRPHRAARLALAAPMACPVLGDRSIVQRLKSLSMTDISTRRRWSGRLLIAASVLALPLTGSISYAQDDTVADVAPPAPPASVAAAPTAPEAPEAPAAIEGSHPRIVRIERRVTHDGNAFKNGILTVALPQEAVDRLLEVARTDPITVDLDSQTVTTPFQDRFSFTVDPFRKHCLANGLDEIGLTLSSESAIAAFEGQQMSSAAWSAIAPRELMTAGKLAV